MSTRAREERQSMSDLIERIPEGYTPKPWFVSGVRSKMDRYAFHTIREDSGPNMVQEAVALVFYDEKQHLVCWADARLISLAPEMADALRERAAEITHLRAERQRLREAMLEAVADLACAMSGSAKRRLNAALAETGDADT